MRERKRILIYGSGAVGSAVGGFLSRYHDVTLLGRRGHLEAVRRRGLAVTGIWGRHLFRRLGIETDFRRLLLARRVYDWIFVTVKAYDTRRAARDVAKLAGPETLVVSLQNGLGNIEILKRRIPSRRLAAGRVIFGSEITSPGKIRITVCAAPTAFGETARQRITERMRRMAREFSRAGISARPCARIEGLLWSKVIYNCALNPLASLLESHYGLLGEVAQTRRVMESVVEEIYAVARRTGVRLDPPSAERYLRIFYSRLLPLTFHHRPSMLQDLERGRRTEIGALNGAIARLGRKYGVRVPVNAALAALIRRREAAK